MKLLLTLSLLLRILTSEQNNFEGELTYTINYSGTMKIGNQEIDMAKKVKTSVNYYDTLKIKIKGDTFIKYLNKSESEKKIFIAGEKKVYTISNETDLAIDDLTYQDLFDRESNYLGKILNFNLKDTVMQNYSNNVKILNVDREYGKEKYVFNTSLQKLPTNRFILVNEDMQIIADQIRGVLGQSIILYYEMTFSKTKLKIQFDLVEIQQKLIPESEFIIPNYMEDLQSKKANKFSERIKMYKIVD